MRIIFHPMKVVLTTWTIGLVFFFALLSGCTDSTPSEGEKVRCLRKIKDCIGRKVSIPDRVEKVVDLAVLDGVRTMVELEAEDMIVGINDSVKDFMYGEEGRTYSCWFAAPKAAPTLKNIISVGNCREPNAELIKSLEPDVVLAYGFRADFAKALEEQTNLPVACIKASGCLDFNMLSLVAEIIGKKERAEELIDYVQMKIEQVTERAVKIPDAERVRVFYWAPPVLGTPRTIAPYDPIDLAGGVNIGMQTGIKSYEIYETTKEQLAVWNPDIILLHWWSKKDIGVKTGTILQDPMLQTVSAVKSRRVFYSRGFMLGWDPAMGVCEVFYMARLFYPEIFKDLDVEKECNEILKKFYGVEGLYTDLITKSDLHRWE